MKSADFEYVRPASLNEALELLSEVEKESRIIAGGQSLMPMMNFRLAKPDRLIDINRICELQEIEIEKDYVNIGSMVRYCDLMSHSDVCKAVPLLPRIIPYIAHEAVRNRGTVGGSISLADPFAELPAMLLALEGSVQLVKLGTSRTVNSGEFFKGVYETDCNPDEIVTGIRLPVAKENDKYGFYELARRHGDYAMVGTVISIPADDSPRIAYFGVSDRPMRISVVEACIHEFLRSGGSFPKEEIEKAFSGIEMVSDSQSSQTMRRHLSGVVLRRAIEGIG